MKTFDYVISKDILGYRELRCTLDDEEGRRVLEIRGTLPKEETWLKKGDIGSTGIDITYLSSEYTRDDILIGLGFYLYWAFEVDCVWSEITLSDPRCILLSEEICDLLQAERLSTQDYILVRCDYRQGNRFEKIITMAFQTGKYDFRL